LGTAVYKPREFAPLINLNVSNAFGVLKSVVDVCLSFDEGK
jgi:translation initiation factor 3 subunit D